MAEAATGLSCTAALLAAVPRLRTAALARLEELVSAESPSGDGARLTSLNASLDAAYTATGARVEHRPGDGAAHLVCTWAASGPDAPAGHVLVLGHSDTVLPAGTTSTRPFRLEGDTLTGPGVYDMKGGLVQVELAMRLLAAIDLPLQREVRLVVVNDEEIGSPDGRHVVAEQSAGAVAVLGLEPPLPGGGLKVGRRGVARYAVVVRGVEAHSGLDQDRGVSATDELVDQLVLLRQALASVPGVTVNVGLLDGGTAANVIAGAAQAEIGVRFDTAAADGLLATTLAGIRPLRAGAQVELVQLTHRPAWQHDGANGVADRLTRLAAALGGELGRGISLGAGDTNATGAAGIPTVDGLGPEGSGAHSPLECASLSSLLHRSALLAAYLATPDG